MSNKKHFFRQSNPFLNNLRAYYKFNNNLVDEIDGNDASGSNISYESGIIGDAILFNGVTSSVSIPDQNYWSFSDGVTDNPFTFTTFIRQKVGGTAVIADKRDGVNNEFQIIILNSRIDVILFDSVAGGTIRAQSMQDVALNTWLMVTVTYNGSGLASGINIYVDGVLSDFSKITSGTYNTINPLSVNVGLGLRTFGNNLKLNGNLDDLRLYDVEYTSTQVQDLYNFLTS